MADNLSFHATHSPMPCPGRFAFLFSDLPDDLSTRIKIINNVQFHRNNARDRNDPTSTQAPIEHNPRSNPGTYVRVLKKVGKVFANPQQAREMCIPVGQLSLNVRGGRCETCEGYDADKIQLHFKAGVWVRYSEGGGTRFMPQVLEIPYRGVNIAQDLDMDANAAFAIFEDHPMIRQMLGTLINDGLGHICLGQSATTLNGGETQRVKLAEELSVNGCGDTLCILDETTVGLHFADIQKLVNILHRLVDQGNTVMVIEHNLDVIKPSDWVIDLGPKGGAMGGYAIAEGTPETVAPVEARYTGQFLRTIMEVSN